MPTLKDWKGVAAGDLKARNRIWVEYQNLVTYAARNLYPTLPNYIDIGDLEGAGQIGLKDAIEKFDLARRIKFETYASSRIRGAMLDSLRKTDWAPRSVRSRNRKVEVATSELTQTLKRTPTVSEIASYVGVSEQEVHRSHASIDGEKIGNIDSPIDSESDDGHGLESILSKDIGDLSDKIASGMDIESMASVIRQLNQREQLTLTLHYLMDYTLSEIGSEFGVTESRVCQIHTEALRSIRKGMINGRK